MLRETPGTSRGSDRVVRLISLPHNRHDRHAPALSPSTRAGLSIARRGRMRAPGPAGTFLPGVYRHGASDPLRQGRRRMLAGSPELGPTDPAPARGGGPASTSWRWRGSATSPRRRTARSDRGTRRGRPRPSTARRGRTRSPGTSASRSSSTASWRCASPTASTTSTSSRSSRRWSPSATGSVACRRIAASGRAELPCPPVALWPRVGPSAIPRRRPELAVDHGEHPGHLGAVHGQPPGLDQVAPTPGPYHGSPA